MYLVPLTILLGAMLQHSPSGLRTELIEDTRTVYSQGYPASASLSDVAGAWRRGNNAVYQVAAINTATPSFGWRLPDGMGCQQSYRILVASSPSLLCEGEADMWDSGEVVSDTTTGVVYGGRTLLPATVYWWSVRCADADGNYTPYAVAQSFITAGEWSDDFSREPLRKTRQMPAETVRGADGATFVDFGKAAFGQLELTVESEAEDTLTIHLGEACAGSRVDRNPGASIRYTSYRVPVHAGSDVYRISFRPDGRNAVIKPHGVDVRPVLMPEYIGEVYPFRYCEIEGGNAVVDAVSREMVHYPWSDSASYFHSSDSVLNAVWDLCRYSILATSFAGVYVDGDRERIPYEADALINQLSHYCVDDEYTMGRYTADYLFRNATWPTEWILQAPILAWNDYMYTGDKSLLKKNYEILKARTLDELTDRNGLISTRTGRQTRDLLLRCGYYGGEIRDIVDWPQSGALGIGKDEPGEADGYELLDYNTVVNAYHYRALELMGMIADALGEEADASEYAAKADDVKSAVNRLLFDKRRGCYRDGIGSEHHSLHASMFPMAFGMVPEKYVKQTMEHIRSRGMACSVYGSQFLLDALYDGGMDDYALSLLTSEGKRGWWNMLASGSTITLEAWDRQFKPNLDWNHAWGAAPANVIPRKLMGIEPIAPGWKRIRIRPRTGSLSEAEIKVPTIAGPVTCHVKRSDRIYDMSVCIPAGCVAELWIPSHFRKPSVTVDGIPVRVSRNGGNGVVELACGAHTVSICEE